MQLPFAILAFAATVVAQPLVDSDVLEPSVRNEVDHALSRVEKVEKKVGGESRWTADDNSSLPTANCQLPNSSFPFPTNGMSRTDIAIRLVSEQNSDGRWRVGTNDVTAAAVELLKSL